MASGYNESPIEDEREIEVGNWPIAFFVFAAVVFIGGGILTVLTELL